MRKLPNVIRNVTSTQTVKVNLAFAANDIETLAYNATDDATVCHMTLARSLIRESRCMFYAGSLTLSTLTTAS